MADTVTIHTDGACSGNPGPGGWAAILTCGGREMELSCGEAHTTNNRMELTAVIEGLRALKKPSVVELYTDSKYVADAFLQNWIQGWIKRSWKNVKNPDLWKELLELMDMHKVSFNWVKGHDTNEMNNRCDKLACIQRDRFAADPADTSPVIKITGIDTGAAPADTTEKGENNMIKVIVTGAMGHMGAILINMIEASEKFTLAAAVDPMSRGDTILPQLDAFKGEADIVIDFSHHTAAPGILDWAIRHNTAVMIATTGHDEAEKALIKAAADKIPVFHSANMSMGIALLAELAKKAAAVFPEADVEIIERHHNRKLDAPSGTALMLAEAVRSARPEATFKTGRSGMAKREKGEIGIHAVRMGNLPGTHEVIINTGTQQITLGHEVYDRALFAEGALTAAEYMQGKGPGLYDMSLVVKG